MRTIAYPGPPFHPDVPLAQKAKCNISNVATERSCRAMRLLHDKGGLFIVENPVRRSDDRGPWKRFASTKFSEHYSFWQVPCVLDTARYTGARLAHVPLCSGSPMRTGTNAPPSKST